MENRMLKEKVGQTMENLAMEASKASSKVFARWDAAELIDLK